MSKDQYTGLEIAVIGMDGRFPGAASVAELWDLLKEGREGISTFEKDELIAGGIPKQLVDHPNFVGAKGIIGEIENFDNEFFGYTAKEAQLLDPQVRIFLECAWATLEDAGYDPHSYRKKIGMFTGAYPNLYWTMGTYLSETGGSFGDYANKDLLSTRVSYKLDLTGPSYTSFTACSTSLVTIHQACRSLLGGECDMALAGGISIELPEKKGYVHQEGMIFSEDGHHKSFDDSATGAVFGDGVGVVLLKPLEDAINDQDHIYAVIKGSAINNDGNRKVGYTAPGIKGQAAVIEEALQVADVDPQSVSYVECHGSATNLGDPMEVEALTKVFGKSNGQKTCALGSVKSNLGHLNIAAGVTGFIKTVLSLYHQQLPPTAHFQKINKNIDLDSTLFYVNNRLRQWESEKTRRAGVSSFGIGGTNAHVVLEEYIPEKRSQASKQDQVLLLSARTSTALDQYKTKLAKYLENTEASLADISYTLTYGRHSFSNREVLVGKTKEEVLEQLLNDDPDQTQRTALGDEPHAKIIFMFPGQGSQYVNMGKDLYEEFGVFRQEMDKGFELLLRLLKIDFRSILYTSDTETASQINDTRYTQPILFVFEYAMTRLIQSFGVQPDLMIGHSFGEYVAACISEAISYEEALQLVIKRGALTSSLPHGEGGMLAVTIDESELLKIKPPNLDIAAVNSNKSCVVSGVHSDLSALKEILVEKSIRFREMKISHAFHSRMMDPVVSSYQQEVAKVNFVKPKVPFLSNLTGELATFAEIKTPEYWADHLRHTVRFYENAKNILSDSQNIIIEVGPGNTLTTLVNQTSSPDQADKILNLVRHHNEVSNDLRYLLTRLGQLWANGVEVDWKSIYSDKEAQRISMPTYAFDKHHFWLKKPDLLGKIEKLKAGELDEKPQSEASKCAWNYQPLPSAIRNREKELAKPTVIISDDNQFFNVLNRDQQYPAQQLINDYHQWSWIDEKMTANSGEEGLRIIYVAPAIGDEPLLLPYIESFQKLVKKINQHKKTIDLLVVSNSSTDIEFIAGTNHLSGLLHAIAENLLEHKAHYKRIEYHRMATGDFNSFVSKEDEMFLNELLSMEDDFVWLHHASRYIRSKSPIQVTSPDDIGHYDLFVGDLQDTAIQLLEDQDARVDQTAWIPTGFFPGLDTALESDSFNEQFIHYREGLRDDTFDIKADLKNILSTNNRKQSTEEREALNVLHELGILAFCEYLSQGGLLFEAGHTIEKQTLIEKLAIQPKFLPLLEYAIHILSKENMLTVAEGQIEVLRTVDLPGRKEEIEGRMESEYPSLLPLKSLTEHCLEHYYKALSGEVSAIGVLFPGGSSEMLDKVSGSAALSSTSEDLFKKIKQLISHYMSQRSLNRPFRILEVGAGRGELTKHVISTLADFEVEYTFTDIGQTFLIAAKEKFEGQFSNVQFSLLDITKDPIAQGYEPFHYDLVLAYDVIHATASLSNAIANASKLLVPGGLLCLLENILDLPLTNFVWGLADGWWSFEDKDIRKHSPLVASETWVNQLQHHDFQFVASTNILNDTDLADHDLFVAQTMQSPEYPGFIDTMNEKYQRELELERTLLAQVQKLQERGSLLVSLPKEQQSASILGDALLQKETKTKTIFYQPALNARWSQNMQDLNVLKQHAIKWGAESVTILLNDQEPAGSLEKSLLIQSIHQFVNFSNQSTNIVWVCVDAVSDTLRQKQLGDEREAKIVKLLAGAHDLSGVIHFNEAYNGERNPDQLHDNLPSEKAHTAANPSLTEDETLSKMLGIWQAIFGKEEILPDANYMQLGGDSLMMVSTIAMIEREFQVKILVKEFYENLTARKLSKLVKSRNSSAVTKIASAKEQAYYATTDAQQAMFYIQMLNPDSTSYNITQVIELKKEVDEERLEEAIIKVIAKHEILRTSFEITEGKVVQVIQEQPQLIFRHEVDQSQNLKEVIEDLIKPFKLVKEIPFRMNLFKWQESIILLMDIHHINFDGISIEVFKNDLLGAYQGIDIGTPELQFKDFSEWQQTDEFQARLDSQLSYWVQKFEQQVEDVNLPYDFDHQDMVKGTGHHFSYHLQSELSKHIVQQATETNAGLFNYLLTAAFILIHKYSQQRDLVIGTGTQGRNFPGLREVMGNFVNTVAYRVEVKPELSHRMLLAEVKNTVNEGLENQDYPYEQLVSKLPYNEGKKDKSLFNVALTLVTKSLVDQEIKQDNELVNSFIEFYDDTYKFDLDFNAIQHHDDRLEILMEYASSLFAEATINKLLEHYEEVLRQVTQDQDILVRDIVLSGLSVEGQSDEQPADSQSNNAKKAFTESLFSHRF